MSSWRSPVGRLEVRGALALQVAQVALLLGSTGCGIPPSDDTALLVLAPATADPPALPGVVGYGYVAQARGGRCIEVSIYNGHVVVPALGNEARETIAAPLADTTAARDRASTMLVLAFPAGTVARLVAVLWSEDESHGKCTGSPVATAWTQVPDDGNAAGGGSDGQSGGSSGTDDAGSSGSGLSEGETGQDGGASSGGSDTGSSTGAASTGTSPSTSGGSSAGGTG